MKVRDMMYPSLTLLGLSGVVLFGYATWELQRRWNYAWSYKSMVQETVREMVKEEALRPR